ncbi:relaxation protein, partial [Escherichia coli]|nr:relaxation protein [Escherichia coli]
TQTPNQAEHTEAEEDAVSGSVFDFYKEPYILNELVSDAMKDILEEIDLQSLVYDAMAEFEGIHQEMVRQQERTALA